MDSKKASEISALAKLIRESLELHVPVDVMLAVERLGGVVKPLGNIDREPEATVRRTGERFEITIKENHLPTRTRFSIAHELGHLFLHMGYLVDPSAWGHSSEYRDSVYHRYGYGIEEAEANLFAAAFLMPEDDYRAEVQRLQKMGEFQIKNLANHFRTSAAATLKRGQELGILRINANGFQKFD